MRYVIALSLLIAGIASWAHDVHPLSSRKIPLSSVEYSVVGGMPIEYPYGMAAGAADVNDDTVLTLTYHTFTYGEDIMMSAPDIENGYRGWLDKYPSSGTVDYCLLFTNRHYLDPKIDDGDEHLIAHTTIHELGHCFGLAHPTDSSETMYVDPIPCTSNPAAAVCHPTPDFIHQIDHLY